MSDLKVYRAGLELKSYAPGQFRAVFATLNVVDHDGDLTLPGAFTRGQPVIIEPWNHGQGLPVGKGVIGCDDRQAWVEGRFLLETQSGREHYEAVKELGPLTEWSYTFRIVKSSPGRDGAKRILEKLDVHGVSPVTRAAGVNTRTEMIKGARDPWRNPRIALGIIAAEKADHERLIERKLADLEARLKSAEGKPTNLDRIAEAIRREYGYDIPSDQWLQTMVAARAEQIIRERIDREPWENPERVRARVLRWLKRPARR